MSISSSIDIAGVAVITGGASGFGLETAERLVKAGMAVAVLDVSETELANAEKSLGALGGGKVAAVKCNVTDFAQCTQAQAAVQAAFGNQPGEPQCVMQFPVFNERNRQCRSFSIMRASRASSQDLPSSPASLMPGNPSFR